MNKISKLASAVGLMLTVIFSTGLGCYENDPEPKPPVTPTDTDTPEKLISNQSSQPTPTRKLVSWGYKGNEYIFVHEIGTINGAFIGFLTAAAHYDGGPGGMSITYSASEARTRAESYSIKNVERTTTQVSGGVNVSVPVLSVFKLGANLGFETTWESITESTLGTSFSEMIQTAYAVTHDIVPERGAGYYALAGVTRYSVYQTTIYNPITNQIVSRDVWFAQAHGEPEMNIHLVKSSENGSFNLDVLNGIGVGSLTPIQNITPDELEKVRNWASSNTIVCNFTNVGSSKTLDNQGWNTDWSSYTQLDRISYMFNNDMRDVNGNAVDIDSLKTLGYKKVQLDLEYDHTKQSNSMQISFKIVNKTTSAQFAETDAMVINGRCSFLFDLSKISKGHDVDVEFRRKKTNALANSGLTIQGNRKYKWTFSN